MKYFITLISIIITSSILSAQEKAPIVWKTVQQADSLQLKGDLRPLFVDVYTDWCGPCKLMDKTTFHDENIAKYVNENFIPVKFNAESEEQVIFKGKIYQWVSNGRTGIQSLAYFMLGGELRYPSVAIVNKEGQTLTVIAGFIQADDFLDIIKDVKRQVDELTSKEKL